MTVKELLAALEPYADKHGDLPVRKLVFPAGEAPISTDAGGVDAYDIDWVERERPLGDATEDNWFISLN